MRVTVKTWAMMGFLALCAAQVQAQTADEVIEKHLAAIGGRPALAKLESRIATGTISVSAQGADLGGSIEMYAKAPNKSRSYSRIDLSQFGAGEVVVDQRCDGTTGYSINSMQGDREVTGDQLQSMLNATFPTPLLTYKDAGAKVELVGKEKLGDRAVIAVLYTPKAGPSAKEYFDADTYLLVRTITKMNIQEAGGEIESTSDFSDYREVDGVKIPFKVNVINPLQAVTITLSKVEHNKPIDDAMFSKPK